MISLIPLTSSLLLQTLSADVQWRARTAHGSCHLASSRSANCSSFASRTWAPCPPGRSRSIEDLRVCANDRSPSFCCNASLFSFVLYQRFYSTSTGLIAFRQVVLSFKRRLPLSSPFLRSCSLPHFSPLGHFSDHHVQSGANRPHDARAYFF